MTITPEAGPDTAAPPVPGPALDPVTGLALALFHRPGGYAVLLGSGISRSAGVPTGWEVAVDLVRKAAAAAGGGPGPDASEAELLRWWEKRAGGAVAYDEVISAVGPGDRDRAALLRGYFEPDDDDRAAGRKIPTDAHRSLARIVATGLVRVVITTNFDRLTEQALQAEGVVPQVIASDTDAADHQPLHLTRCTIIKMHGDYIRGPLRNTAAELASYDDAPHLKALLDRVLDEHGLLVTGWSADYDTALLHALSAGRSRRWTTFFHAHRGELAAPAQDLVAQRDAVVLRHDGADALLRDVERAVDGLRGLARAPVSDDAQVVAFKRALPDGSRRTEARDLVLEETDRVCAGLTADRYPCASPTGEPISAESPEFVAYYAERLDQYDRDLSRLLRLVAVGAHDDEDGRLDGLWRRVAERLARGRPSTALGEALHSLLRAEYYPAAQVVYAAGAGAVASGRAHLLPGLLTLPVVHDQVPTGVTLGRLIYDSGVVDRELARRLPDGEAHRRVELAIHARHRDGTLPVLRDVLDPTEANRALDQFEYLAGLFLHATDGYGNPGHAAWLSRYGWPDVLAEIDQGIHVNDGRSLARALLDGAGDSLTWTALEDAREILYGRWDKNRYNE